MPADEHAGSNNGGCTQQAATDSSTGNVRMAEALPLRASRFDGRSGAGHVLLLNLGQVAAQSRCVQDLHVAVIIMAWAHVPLRHSQGRCAPPGCP